MVTEGAPQGTKCRRCGMEPLGCGCAVFDAERKQVREPLFFQEGIMEKLVGRADYAPGTIRKVWPKAYPGIVLMFSQGGWWPHRTLIKYHRDGDAAASLQAICGAFPVGEYLVGPGVGDALSVPEISDGLMDWILEYCPEGI